MSELDADGLPIDKPLRGRPRKDYMNGNTQQTHLLHTDCITPILDKINNAQQMNIKASDQDNVDSLSDWNEQNLEAASPAIEESMHDEDCKVVCTAKGRKAIEFQGFTYRFDKLTSNGVCKWRCLADFCRGRLSTVGHNPPLQPQAINFHNHRPDEPKSRRWKRKKELHKSIYNQAPLMEEPDTQINASGQRSLIPPKRGFIVDSVTGEMRPLDLPHNVPSTLPASEALTNAVTQAMLLHGAQMYNTHATGLNVEVAKKPKIEMEHEVEEDIVIPTNPVRTAKDPTKEAPIFNHQSVPPHHFQHTPAKDPTKEAPLFFPPVAALRCQPPVQRQAPAVSKESINKPIEPMVCKEAVSLNQLFERKVCNDMEILPPLVDFPPANDKCVKDKPVSIPVETDPTIQEGVDEDEEAQLSNVLKVIRSLNDSDMQKRLITQQLMKVKDQRRLIKEQSLLYSEQRYLAKLQTTRMILELRQMDPDFIPPPRYQMNTM